MQAEGSILPYAIAIMPMVLLSTVGSHILWRSLLAKAYNAIGTRPVLQGYAAMLLPIGCVAAYGATSVMSAVNEILAGIVYIYFVAAIFGLPVILLLQRYRRLNLVYATFIVTAVALTFYFLEGLSELPTVENAVTRWTRAFRDVAAYAAIVTVAFCLGARIPFLHQVSRRER